jgi:hypothetical protein
MLLSNYIKASGNSIEQCPAMTVDNRDDRTKDFFLKKREYRVNSLLPLTIFITSSIRTYVRQHALPTTISLSFERMD